MPEAELRSLAFVTLVVGNIALILAGRSFSTSIRARAFEAQPRCCGLFLALMQSCGGHSQLANHA